MPSDLDPMLQLITWIVTVLVPTIIAIIKHLKARAYKQACESLIEMIEKYDTGTVKKAVATNVQCAVQEGVIDPYLEKKGYSNGQETKSSSDNQPVA